MAMRCGGAGEQYNVCSIVPYTLEPRQTMGHFISPIPDTIFIYHKTLQLILEKICEKRGENRRIRQYISQYRASLRLTRSLPDFLNFCSNYPQYGHRRGLDNSTSCGIRHGAAPRGRGIVILWNNAASSIRLDVNALLQASIDSSSLLRCELEFCFKYPGSTTLFCIS
jgi:hypothetical protein